MSPEEMQVVIGEWFTALGGVHDELWEMDKDKLDDDTHESVLKITNVINKLMRDMDVFRWSDADRDKAFTLVAGYVTQSNVERQARRDADLAKHKAMVDKAADQRIAEAVSNLEARTRVAERKAEDAQTRADNAITQAALDLVEQGKRLDAQFADRVEAEVQRRLIGETESATPGRRKRPLVIG